MLLVKKCISTTAIDECTRFRYIAAFQEANTYSSIVFLKQLRKRFKFQIHCVQTNRFGNTKSDKKTLFEISLAAFGIEHKKIRPYTPRHSGKVERSHRKDNEQFYAKYKFYSFDDFQKQLVAHNRRYNTFPMHPLNWKSPKEVLHSFLSKM